MEAALTPNLVGCIWTTKKQNVSRQTSAGQNAPLRLSFSSNLILLRHGKINFVDLAGSEMTKKTKSEGKTLEEANNINKSLMVLGYCIAQLSSQKKSQASIIKLFLMAYLFILTTISILTCGRTYYLSG